jgi:hypothetical protein
MNTKISIAFIIAAVVLITTAWWPLVASLLRKKFPRKMRPTPPPAVTVDSDRKLDGDSDQITPQERPSPVKK